jgi:CHAT domain-containing protein
MTGEPEQQWTVETLKELVYMLRDADQKAVAAALAAAEKAVAAALAAAEKANEISAQAAKEWRIASNEWRGAMDDRDRSAAAALEKYAQKDSMETMRVTLQKDLDDLKSWRHKNEGEEIGSQAQRSEVRADTGTLRGTQMVMAGFASAGVALIIGLALIALAIYNHK